MRENELRCDGFEPLGHYSLRGVRDPTTNCTSNTPARRESARSWMFRDDGTRCSERSKRP